MTPTQILIPAQTSPHSKLPRILTNAALLLLLTLTALTIAWLYCSSERFFGYWDYGGYWLVTVDKADLLHASYHAFLQSVKDSMGQDYTHLYTLPLAPFLLLFGPNAYALKTTYVAGVVLIYYIPFALLIGGIAARLVPTRSFLAFWLGAFTAIALPTIWATTLRGYPDVGAAALIALLYFTFFTDPKMNRPWQLLAVGLALAFAPLFRRHYAYDVMLFILFWAGYILIQAALQFRAAKKFPLRYLLLQTLHMIIAGAISCTVMALIGRDWIHYALTLQRAQLYSSYEVPLRVFVDYNIDAFGWLIWLVILAGFLGLLRTTKSTRPLTAFLLLSQLTLIALWMFKLRYVALCYTLHFAPLTILGVTFALLLCLTHFQHLATRIITTTYLIALLLLNLEMGLTSAIPPPALNTARNALALPNGPLWRSDYDEVSRLVDFLRDTATPKDAIYVVDSSSLLNNDLLHIAERQLHGTADRRLNVMLSPQIDSRDFSPLGNLLQADYIVLTSPLYQSKAHMAPQKVVTAPADALLNNYDIAHDFAQLPTTFTFENQAHVIVLKRLHPSSMATALNTALRLVNDNGPLGNPTWCIIQQPFPSNANTAPDGSATINTHLGFLDHTPLAPTILYTGPVPTGHLQLTLSFADKVNFLNPSPPLVQLKAVDAQGHITTLAETLCPHGQRVYPLSLPFTAPPTTRTLFLQISAGGPNPRITNGTLLLENLRLTQ